jgi:hypothetical protein
MMQGRSGSSIPKRRLAISPWRLTLYRSLSGGPGFHKFGKDVRYAVDDLDA